MAGIKGILFFFLLFPLAWGQRGILRDFYELEDPALRRVAQSVAVGIDRNHLISLGNSTIHIRGADLPREKMCLLEEFHPQGRVHSAGAGFLVAPDLLLTAGHNVEGPEECASKVWVFDYLLQGPGGWGRHFTVKRSSVYGCVEILSQESPPCGGSDRALIRLDRAVEGRDPLKIRTSGEISSNARLYLFGYPRGFPLKVATAEVIFHGDEEVFYTSFGLGGLSGGPAFNLATGIVEGVISCMITNGGHRAYGPKRSLYNEQKDCFYYEGNFRDPMAGTGIITRLEAISTQP